MDWQQPASLAVVAVTGFFFVRSRIRVRRKMRSRLCGSDCGCGTPGEPGPEDGVARTKTGTPDGHSGSRRDAAGS